MNRSLIHRPLAIYAIIAGILAGGAALALWSEGARQPQTTPTPEAVQHAIQQTVEHCWNVTGTIERLHCWENAAEETLTRYSFATINEGLEHASFDCHDFMHYVARKAYADLDDLPALYDQATYACFGAAYHGGVEGFLESRGLAGAPPQEIITTIRDVCEGDKLTDTSNIRNQCYHGLGHALMVISDGDLPASLEFCSALETNDGRPLDMICAGGVFMENLPNSQTNPHVPRYIKASDPLFPCNAIPERFEETCYGFQTSHFNDLTNGNVNQTIDLCLQVPDEYQDTCVRHIGTGLLGKYTDYETLAATCAQMPMSALRQACSRGVVISYFDRFAGVPERLRGMFAYCEHVPSTDTAACQDQIYRTLTNAFAGDPDARERFCAQVSEEHRSLCTRDIQ